MSVFADAVEAIFADPNLGESGIRRDAQGAETPLRVLRRRPDEEQGWNGARILSESDLLEIRVAEAPDLAPGDVILIGAETLTVVGEPSRDADRLVWLAQVRPA